VVISVSLTGNRSVTGGNRLGANQLVALPIPPTKRVLTGENNSKPYSIFDEVCFTGAEWSWA
jgi:hypothetical protein